MFYWHSFCPAYTPPNSEKGSNLKKKTNTLFWNNFKFTEKFQKSSENFLHSISPNVIILRYHFSCVKTKK